MPDDPEVYVPDPADLSDDEAQEMKAFGCAGESLIDPWFDDDEQAQTWEPPAGFDSERA